MNGCQEFSCEPIGLAPLVLSPASFHTQPLSPEDQDDWERAGLGKRGCASVSTLLVWPGPQFPEHPSHVIKREAQEGKRYRHCRGLSWVLRSPAHVLMEDFSWACGVNQEKHSHVSIVDQWTSWYSWKPPLGFEFSLGQRSINESGVRMVF